jgi:HD-GYP domain-containing protein (c-di-GMP phosphodiesterase class II)
MEIEERQVRVHELRIGMFVSRLDRPWTETPFALQGFMIRNRAQVERLAEYCESVYIDVLKSSAAEPMPALRTLARGAGGGNAAAGTGGAGGGGAGGAGSAIGAIPTSSSREASWLAAIEYPRDIAVEDELPHANAAMETVSERATWILDSLRSGRNVSREQITAAVAPVVASLVRNPDAFFWLETLRKRDDYAYGHAINCCALAAAFGRYLGFPEMVLHDLAAGGMLLDIGMTRVPADLLQRNGPLDAAETQAVRRHVEEGLKLYDDAGFGNEDVRTMLRTHHERYDASGYPAGVPLRQIPLLGRIAGIVDSFDAMTSARPFRPALSRAAALQALYRERGRLYQPELVEQFVQCLGVYPVGTLVELSTGEVGIVMAQNPTRRLRPKLMLLTDPDKRLRENFLSLDLLTMRYGEVEDSDVHIVRSLDPGAYGLEPTELYL